MEKPVAKFIIKLFVFCFPVILLLSFYIVTDPFKVIYHYDAYYSSDGKPYVAINQDYVSTETFLNNYSNYEYDSFIFGSSRSMFYQVKDWREHISTKRCFHFDAAAESLYGINAKIKFLNQKEIPIKNALIILDTDVLSQTNNTQGHLFQKHPELSGQNRFLFQMEFIKAFFNKHFLTEYIRFKLSGKVEKDLNQGGYLVDGKLSEYDFIANETHLISNENLINNNPYDYYSDRTHGFFKRSIAFNIYSPVITDNQKRLLEEIFEIFKHNKTEYRIIISPLYNQFKLNAEDYNYLTGLFGEKNVYDFSGINEITGNIINYYDWSHYRPHVAKYILNKVYTFKKNY